MIRGVILAILAVILAVILIGTCACMRTQAQTPLSTVSSAKPVRDPYLNMDLEHLSLVRRTNTLKNVGEYAPTISEEEAEPEPISEVSEESSEPEWIYYGECRITHYDDCAECCGVAGNATASGVYPTAGYTVAAGEDLPFGTEVLIGDRVYVVEDRGVDCQQIDIFVSDHETALAMGMYYTDVYVRY